MLLRLLEQSGKFFIENVFSVKMRILKSQWISKCLWKYWVLPLSYKILSKQYLNTWRRQTSMDLNVGVFWTATGNFLIYYLWVHSLFPPKDICTSNYLSSIQFQLGGWARARCGICVEMRCVEWTCSEVFQKPFLICMSGSVCKMENVILVFSLTCFNSVVNTLENGMGSAGPQHVCVCVAGVVFILSLRFRTKIWIAMCRSHPLNLGSMESL